MSSIRGGNRGVKRGRSAVHRRHTHRQPRRHHRARVEVLRAVDRVVAEDTRHSRRLLTHLAIDRPMMSLHEHNETDAAQRVIDYLLAGESLALISDAGTPLISDPGFSLVRAAGAGYRVVPVPGPSALIAALSVSGLPTDRFRFEGFLPRRQQARLAHLETCGTRRSP